MTATAHDLPDGPEARDRLLERCRLWARRSGLPLADAFRLVCHHANAVLRALGEPEIGDPSAVSDMPTPALRQLGALLERTRPVQAKAKGHRAEAWGQPSQSHPGDLVLASVEDDTRSVPVVGVYRVVESGRCVDGSWYWAGVADKQAAE